MTMRRIWLAFTLFVTIGCGRAGCPIGQASVPVRAGHEMCVSQRYADLIGCFEISGLTEAADYLKIKVSGSVGEIGADGEIIKDVRDKYSDKGVQSKIDGCLDKLPSAEEYESSAREQRRAETREKDAEPIWGMVAGGAVLTAVSIGGGIYGGMMLDKGNDAGILILSLDLIPLTTGTILFACGFRGCNN